MKNLMLKQPPNQLANVYHVQRESNYQTSLYLNGPKLSNHCMRCNSDAILLPDWIPSQIYDYWTDNRMHLNTSPLIK